jgi:hypothetical protein
MSIVDTIYVGETLLDLEAKKVMTKLLTDGALTSPVAVESYGANVGNDLGVTARAGGGQALATVLKSTTSFHEVTTVATAADSVALPRLATGSGDVHMVKNSAAVNSMQLFGQGTDTIDGVATGTGVAIGAGKSRFCVDAAPGKWHSQLGA